MTKVSYGEYGDRLHFSSNGHSNYHNEDNGNNDVCVAVSTLNIMLIQYFHGVNGTDTTVMNGNVVITSPANTITRVVFDAAIKGFKWLEETYPGHVKVN